MNTFEVDEKKGIKSRSGIMLPVVELVIAIGLFAVISVFILRFFTSANAMSKNADDISKAVIKAESVLELAKALSFEDAAAEFGASVLETADGKQMEASYDKEWKNTRENPSYLLKVTEKTEQLSNGIMYNYHVAVAKNVSEDAVVLVELEGSKYKKGE